MPDRNSCPFYHAGFSRSGAGKTSYFVPILASEGNDFIRDCRYRDRLKKPERQKVQRREINELKQKDNEDVSCRCDDVGDGFPTSVFAASGDVTSIEFDTNESKIYLTVNETSEQLRVLANIEGSSTKKDVTNESTWTSSNTRIVKVDGGLIIPLEKGTARITAKYKGAIKTIDVDVKFAIDEFKLDQPDKVEHKLGTEGLTVKALADGTNDVTTEAKWTTSDDSVVKVSKGELTLVGLGSATVTAEYKGLKASLRLKSLRLTKSLRSCRAKIRSSWLAMRLLS